LIDFVAQDDTSKSILVIGAAGGVGSILVHKKLTKLNIIATASREVTTAWLKELGADTVINHHKKLSEEFKVQSFRPDYIVSLNGTEQQETRLLK
jgi:NADPH:quinone reductase-like Zn-dependent oxidoreductase